MRVTSVLFVLALTLVFAAKPSRAQDPTKVDPKHYKVEFENDKVRILRVTYGPGEKSVMHGHPDAVAVMLSDSHSKLNSPDGKSQVMTVKAGQAFWTPAGKHLPENIGDKPYELIVVELKSKKK